METTTFITVLNAVIVVALIAVVLMMRRTPTRATVVD